MVTAYSARSELQSFRAFLLSEACLLTPGPGAPAGGGAAARGAAPAATPRLPVLHIALLLQLSPFSSWGLTGVKELGARPGGGGSTGSAHFPAGGHCRPTALPPAVGRSAQIQLHQAHQFWLQTSHPPSLRLPALSAP